MTKLGSKERTFAELLVVVVFLPLFDPAPCPLPPPFGFDPSPCPLPPPFGLMVLSGIAVDFVGSHLSVAQVQTLKVSDLRGSIDLVGQSDFPEDRSIHALACLSQNVKLSERWSRSCSTNRE